MPNSDYYYEIPGSNIAHTSVCTNNLDFGELLDKGGATPWILPYGAKIKKKKTLIIHAPQLFERDIYQRVVAAERLEELEKEGFEIYLYQKEGVLKKLVTSALYKSNLNELFYQGEVTDEIVAKEAVEKLGLSRDQVLVLNQNEIELLVERDEKDWAACYVSDRLDLYGANLSGPSLAALIQEKQDSITSLNLSGCFNLRGKLFSPDLCLPNLTELILGGNLSIDMGQGLEPRKMMMDGESVEWLVKSSDQLTHIDLCNCVHIALNVLFGIQRPERLKVLKLAGFEWADNQALLINIFRNAKLKVLDLSRCTKLSNSMFDDPNFNFGSLEELYLDESDISDDSLIKILTQAKNLKRFHCGKLTDEIIQALNPALLEELHCSDISSVSAEVWRNFFGQANQLKDLDLKKGALPAEAVGALNSILLERLSLKVDETNITPLARCLADAKKLKELKISGTLWNSNLDEILLALHTDSLQILEVDGFLKINKSTLFVKFLSRAKELTKLILKGVFLQADDMDQQALNLGLLKLKELVLPFSQYTEHEIEKILSSSPALEKFVLKDDHVLLKRISPHLKKFKVGFVLSLKGFAEAKYLEKLTLVNERNMGEMSVDFDFPSLKELEVRGFSIQDAILIKKIIASSNYKVRITGYPGNAADLDLDVSGSNATVSIAANQEVFEEKHSAGPFSPFPPAATASNAAAPVLATDTATIDADTTADPNKSFNVKQIFRRKDGKPDPDVSLYRLRNFNTHEVASEPCHINQAFKLSNKGDLQLVPPPGSFEETKEDTYEDLYHPLDGNEYYYGKISLSLTDEWQALPSLSAQETITKYHLSNPSAAVEIQYSKRDNLYYIRSKNPAPILVDIDFILKIPREAELALSAAELPSDIFDKLERCRTPGIATLDLPAGPKTGEIYLAAFQKAAREKKPVGACPHRAVLFKDWMDKDHPEIPVRIVRNKCHDFIEMDLKANGDWRIYNLGGYPAELTVSDPHRPNQTQPSATVAQLTPAGTVNLPSTKKCYFPLPEPKPLPTSSKEYIQSLFSEGHKKQLILLDDKQSIKALGLGLDSYCLGTSRPCFYVNSPTDLVCSAPFVERDEKNAGTLRAGPGGPLHRFLTVHQGKNPLIIVDYSNFDPNEIVQFNTLFDLTRTVDGTELSEDVVVIGLMDPKSKNSYTDDDFYSRLDTFPLASPLSKESFPQPITVPHLDQAEVKEEETIWMFGDDSWEGQLLGHWDFSETGLHFIEGELIKALQIFEKNKQESKEQDERDTLDIRLNNAPWDNERFTEFVQRILHHGVIKTPYGEYWLPKKFNLTQSQHYPWTKYAEQIQIGPVAQGDLEKALVINPMLFPGFLSQKVCDNATKTLKSVPGFVEQYKGQTLPLYISAPLTPHMWARLLHTCKKHNVTIDPVCAPGVTFPAELNIKTPVISTETKLWSFAGDSKEDFFVCSTDTDVTASQIQADCYIDVSKLDPGALLKRINPILNKKEATLHFEAQEGALIKLLEQDKTVVLTGTIQPMMVDVLNAFLLQRQQKKLEGQLVKGQLVIVSQQPDLFPVSASFEHTVTAAEKKEALEKYYRYLFMEEAGEEKSPAQPLSVIFSEDEYEQHSFVKLQSMLISYLVHKDKHRAGEGMLSLPKSPPVADEDLTNLTEEASVAFVEGRINTLEASLNKAPCVFVAGKTAVGKTTFIEKFWKKKHPKTYIGEDEAILKEWANDRSEQEEEDIFLFIDEVNISGKQWSQFEGLFRIPRGIMIGNEYFPLTKKHKIIGAGNPVSDGGERQLSTFFKRHGNSIIFEPMPPAFIYHEVLKPVLKEISSIDNQILAEPFLKVAQFLTNCSTNKVLISPRELATMALYTTCYCKNYPSANPLAVAKYYAWHLAKNLVPEAHKEVFKKQWTPEPALKRSSVALSPWRFTVNASNQPALDALNDALDLHALRQTEPEGSPLKSGGLGGIILEGEPESGKSTLARELLLARGFVKGVLREPDVDQVPSDQSVFYEFPASMPLMEKEKWLPKLVAKKNAVILADEINSVAIMECLYNPLLMTGGALLIGTQNPVTQEARVRSTNALERRLRKVVIPSSTRQERIDILKNIRLAEEISIGFSEEECTKLSDEVCIDMIDEYLERRKNAQEQNAKKPGSASSIYFRQVIKRAKQELEAIKRPQKKALIDKLDRQFTALLALIEQDIQEKIKYRIEGWTDKSAQPIKQALRILSDPSHKQKIVKRIAAKVYRKKNSALSAFVDELDQGKRYEVTTDGQSLNDFNPKQYVEGLSLKNMLELGFSHSWSHEHETHGGEHSLSKLRLYTEALGCDAAPIVTSMGAPKLPAVSDTDKKAKSYLGVVSSSGKISFFGFPSRRRVTGKPANDAVSTRSKKKASLPGTGTRK